MKYPKMRAQILAPNELEGRADYVGMGWIGRDRQP